MKKFSRIFKYLTLYKSKFSLYIFTTLMATILGVFSLALLSPFVSLIVMDNSSAVNALSTNNKVLSWVNSYLNVLLQTKGKIYALAAVCIFIILATFLKNLFIYLSNIISAPIRAAVVMHLRNDLFEKTLHLPVGYFSEQRKGDLMSRMTNDVNEVESSIISVLEGMIKDPLAILGYLIAMIIISPTLSLFLLILLPITAFIIGRISRRLKKESLQASEELSLSFSIMEETLTGIRVVKAFLAEKMLQRRFVDVNNRLFSLRKSMAARRDLASPLTELLGVIVLCVVLFYGGLLAIKYQTISGGDLLAYIAMFAIIINPAKYLSNSFFNVQRGVAALNRVEDLLNTPIVVEDNGTEELQFNQSIEFRNVSFAYGDTTILKNINLTIEKGKTIALVGSSGAGKSTLADLIPRFHDVTKGEIFIDGKNIKSYSLQSLREHISIVTQEPVLFNDSIAQNIALGKQNATKEEILAAAKVANAIGFIEQKEAQLDTNVGDRGSRLSGGEKQRLTIARAVIKNPPILILDEATSSLDTESERLVQDAINNMMQNRTSIVIAHRLSTIRNADEIVVLHKGEIAERGNHETLMQLSNGIYKKLVDLQEVK